jgi:hypothetical protein
VSVVGLAAGALVLAAQLMPGRRLLPFWGWAAEVGDTVLALLTIPILLQILHVYGWARGLAG